MAMKQEANTPVVLTIGAMSCFLILVIMFGVEAWFRFEQRKELDRLWEESPNHWLLDRRSAQLSHIREGAFEDPNTHARHIPIDSAMQAIVKDGGMLPTTQPAATQPASARAE